MFHYCKLSSTLDFSILIRESNNFSDKPVFNKADSSLPLQLCLITSNDAYLFHCLNAIVL